MSEPAKNLQVMADHRPMAVMTPMDMLSTALTNGTSPEILNRLMDLRDRWEAGQARSAFDEAIAAAKAEIPAVTKNRKGHNDKSYADFAAIARVVDPIITKYGLSYRFRTTQTDRINVTCVLSHKAGHSEENTLSGPTDTSGNKNAIQAIGSTLTYLQRYTLVQALGLAVAEDDDGKAGGTGGAISDEQLSEIRGLIDETGADIRKFCAKFKIDALADLPASRFEAAMKALHDFGARQKAVQS